MTRIIWIFTRNFILFLKTPFLDPSQCGLSLSLNRCAYFPKLKNDFEIQRNKIKLFSRQVFITDEVKDIVPEFLMLLHGVIDSPDIPAQRQPELSAGGQQCKKDQQLYHQESGRQAE